MRNYRSDLMLTLTSSSLSLVGLCASPSDFTRNSRHEPRIDQVIRFHFASTTVFFCPFYTVKVTPSQDAAVIVHFAKLGRLSLRYY